MPSLFVLIGVAWAFCAKQTVLNGIMLCFFVPPTSMLYLLTEYMQNTPAEMLPLSLNGMRIFFMLAAFALSLWMTYGAACVLTVGMRLLKSRAGRSRTSFAAVRKQALPFVFPLLLTDILRDCLLMLWSLPFILAAVTIGMTYGNPYYGFFAAPLFIPAVIFMTRSYFYDILIVAEKMQFRNAILASAGLVRGETSRVFNYLCGIAICFQVPIFFLQRGVGSLTSSVYLASLIFGFGASGLMILGLLTNVCLYRSLLLLKNA